VQAAGAITPWVSPAQAQIVSGGGSPWFLLATLAAAFACFRLVTGAIRVEFERAALQAWSIEMADADAPPPLGFCKSALFTSCAICCVGVALLGGALSDGVWRHGLLAENAAALRDAPVEMFAAAPGMGARSRISASADGVQIRNINVQDLIAVSYGVSHFAVTSNQMYPRETDPEQHSWLRRPYYDVRIRAPIREPEEFDPYALRQRITRLLVERFGLEIHVNGKCQRPCGRWDTRRDSQADPGTLASGGR
jgi:hypothetical protein